MSSSCPLKMAVEVQASAGLHHPLSHISHINSPLPSELPVSAASTIVFSVSQRLKQNTVLSTVGWKRKLTVVELPHLWLLMWIQQAGKWQPCSSCRLCALPTTPCPATSSIAFCGTFLCLEAKGLIVLSGNIKTAAERSSALLLPKHFLGHAFSFSVLHTTTFCISCSLNLEGTMFTCVPHRELNWDYKLAADS